jgi:hypothetical protein
MTTGPLSLARMALVDVARLQLTRTHWLAAFAGTAGAYLFFFYAGVFLELQKPPPLIVFIS